MRSAYCLVTRTVAREPPIAVGTDRGRKRDPDPLSLPLPPKMPVPFVGRRLKCLACGSLKVDGRPKLYPGWIVAMRERCASLCARRKYRSGPAASARKGLALEPDATGL